MKHHPCVQGSVEWLKLRCGKPTASSFDKLITAVKGEPTKGEARRKYLYFLLAELILDMPLSGVTTAAMQHGHDWEAKARAEYEMLMGCNVEPVGFCTNDEETIGASPDGFVGDVGSVEIKSPFNPEIHVGYLLDPESLKQEYWVQTQGQLYITGRQWTDLVSCFAGMPLVRVRITPEPEYQAKLGLALDSFVAEFAGLVDRATAAGWITGEGRTVAKNATVPSQDGFLNESEVEEYIAALKAKGTL